MEGENMTCKEYDGYDAEDDYLLVNKLVRFRHKRFLQIQDSILYWTFISIIFYSFPDIFRYL